MPPFPRTAHTGGGLAYTLPPPAATGIDATIRDAVAMDRWLPAPTRVSAIADRLRAYIGDVTKALEGDNREDVLVAVREARHRVGLGTGDGYTSAITYTRGLGLAAQELRRFERGTA
ncbi:DUF6415 family natural product biosynthesis protein [Streptomyces sp. NPDC008001]|uniref:DUF6415 family natural product biosynthesis protein n=1 Tax=Streptomyces sp. NPDC008001 TaxID=3364804 RepID=UPI0036EB1B60